MSKLEWTAESKKEVCEEIFRVISSEGISLRQVLLRKDMPGRTLFYEWLQEDEDIANQYARACEDRAEGIFDEILEIADSSNADYAGTADDGSLIIDGENIQRSKLKIDARKWVLSKMQPKKYGNKVDVTTDGEKINPTIPLVLSDGRTYEDLKADLKKEEEE